MIKAVIFDCFGVLTTDLWREFVDGLPPEADVKKARELNHQYDAQQISLDEFLQQVEKATGERPQLVEKLLDNETTKNRQLLDYIEQLKTTYKIGLLSNIGTDWITESFLNTQEQQLFDAMVISYKVGTTKPDSEIYKITCEKLGVDPENAVFIDDIPEYCQAAESLGMKSVHYKNFRQMKTELEAILDQS